MLGTTAQGAAVHGDHGETTGMIIDCADCTMQGTDACTDCVVTFVVSREPGQALVIDADEARAVRLLARAGLVPELRHVAVST
jgi:hypothetical protein